MARSEQGGEKAVKKVIGVVIGIFVAIFFMNKGLSSCENEREAEEGRASAGPSAEAEAEKKPFSGPGYVLDFSESFNPGANAIDELGLSVVIAVDISGSMGEAPAAGGEAKHVQAARALKKIVSFLNELRGRPNMRDTELKIGILAFNEGVKVFFPLKSADDAAFRALEGLLSAKDALSPGGRTSIGLVLERGAEILAQSGTIMNSLIVISDGLNTAGVEPAEALFAINENRNDASSVEFPVITRGTIVSFIGFDVDSGAYADLAEQGARLESAADQRGLERALTDILVADISRLEAAP